MNTTEITAVEQLRHDMFEGTCRRNEDDMVFSDLTGLFTEIIGELEKTGKGNSLVIYDYAKALERELLSFSAREAYIAGYAGKDRPADYVWRSYVSAITGDADYHRAEADIQSLYISISGILGDKRELLNEFTEVYRSVHGTVKDSLNEFILLGQRAGAEMAAE